MPTRIASNAETYREKLSPRKFATVIIVTPRNSCCFSNHVLACDRASLAGTRVIINSMKYIVWVLLFSWLSGSASAFIRLDIEVEIPGKKFTPTVTVLEHQWATAENDNFTLRVHAFQERSGYVNIESEIREKVGDVAILKGIPVILTPLGTPGEVTSKEQNGSLLRYRLKITPHNG